MSNSHPSSTNNSTSFKENETELSPVMNSAQEVSTGAVEKHSQNAEERIAAKKDISLAKSEGRYLYVDAIRGIAAVCVVMRHLYYSSLGSALDPIFPAFLKTFHVWGAAGVYAFFVLSGFVITHSLRNNSLSAKAIGNFILRRQIRLDPVYWVVMLLFVTLPSLNFIEIHGSHATFSPAEFAINMFYLQNILHKSPIIDIAWTLCIEIQFYLLFIAILLTGSKAKRLHPSFNISAVSVALLFGMGIAALALKHFSFRSGLFISFWHYFALGALAYWAMQRAISPRIFFAYTGLFVLDTVFCSPSAIYDFGPSHSLSTYAMVVGLFTATSLYYAGTHGKMATWGKTPILQYLGRISYSLYLIHRIVIALLAPHFFPAAISNPVLGIIWYITVFVVSIACAQLLYTLVEKPSMQLATRLKVK